MENKKKDTEIEIIISMFIAISKDKMKRDETTETKRDCREKSIAEISWFEFLREKESFWKKDEIILPRNAFFFQ